MGVVQPADRGRKGRPMPRPPRSPSPGATTSSSRSSDSSDKALYNATGGQPFPVAELSIEVLGGGKGGQTGPGTRGHGADTAAGRARPTNRLTGGGVDAGSAAGSPRAGFAGPGCWPSGGGGSREEAARSRCSPRSTLPGSRPPPRDGKPGGRRRLVQHRVRCSGREATPISVAAGETVYWKVKLAKGQVLKANALPSTSPRSRRTTPVR